MSSNVPSPEEFYGFQLGSDRKLARWDKIVEYFWLLDKLPTVHVEEIGKSTEGNPFLVATITSEENLVNVDRLKEISLRLAHPRGLSSDEVEELIAEGKSVVSITCSLHASEIGGTQVASELAYEVATLSEYQKIRENTVLVLVPSSNPDGNIMVVDWYNKYLGTEYEAGSMPYLYHKYVGHDNNRDAFHLSQVESKLLAKLLYKDWYPQAQIDHHHMGGTGARFSIPPNCDPIYHYIEPLVLAEQQLYGGYMLVELEAAGKTGVESQCSFSLEGGPFWNHAPLLHGICGMLTESASAKVATPSYVHKDQLRPSRLGRPENKPQMNFVHPWTGGWWKLRDILEQIKVASIAALRVASSLREQILRNMYLKATHQMKLGSTQSPYAYIFPPKQRDSLTAVKLLMNLDEADVEVHVAEEEFEAEGNVYPKGTHVVFTSQLCRPYILRLLKSELYHDGPWTKGPNGAPIAPFDFSTFAQQEFMGVHAVEATHPLQGSFKPCSEIRGPEGKVNEGKLGYLLDCRVNISYKAVNRLQARGITVCRAQEDVKVKGRLLPKGSFYIPESQEVGEAVSEMASSLNLEFVGLDTVDFKYYEMKPQKVALYQRYRGGNMDEGWTRWLFEQYEVNFSTVWDKDVKEGLKGYDVLVLPSDATPMITGLKLEEYYKRFGRGRGVPKYPEGYESGIGEDGVQKVKEFIEAGGKLVCMNRSCEFAMEELKVPVVNALKDLKSTDFLCPGSTLKTRFNTDHKITYGMPENGLILFRGAAFNITASEKGEDITVIAEFSGRGLIKSGWLIGEEYLREKYPLLDMKMGEGHVVLFGFSPQARAQTDGTFKLLFNCLIG